MGAATQALSNNSKPLRWNTTFASNEISPTYNDVRIPPVNNQAIALTADEVSRIKYFDIDRFYANRRADYRATMHKVRDMFILSICLYQRHSDMVRISKSCFHRNIFKITQQKTGGVAVVNIDRYSVDPAEAYAILERYNYEAPFKGDISGYNKHLHNLMKDIGFVENVRVDTRLNGEIVSEEVPKWRLIASHTCRRTATTIAVTRGYNMHAIRKCTGHQDLRVLDRYIIDND